MQIARAAAISSYIAGAAQPFRARDEASTVAFIDPAKCPPAGRRELRSFMERLNDAAVLGATPRGQNAAGKES